MYFAKHKERVQQQLDVVGLTLEDIKALTPDHNHLEKNRLRQNPTTCLSSLPLTLSGLSWHLTRHWPSYNTSAKAWQVCHFTWFTSGSIPTTSWKTSETMTLGGKACWQEDSLSLMHDREMMAYYAPILKLDGDFVKWLQEKRIIQLCISLGNKEGVVSPALLLVKNGCMGICQVLQQVAEWVAGVPHTCGNKVSSLITGILNMVLQNLSYTSNTK